MMCVSSLDRVNGAAAESPTHTPRASPSPRHTPTAGGETTTAFAFDTTTHATTRSKTTPTTVSLPVLLVVLVVATTVSFHAGHVYARPWWRHGSRLPLSSSSSSVGSTIPAASVLLVHEHNWFHHSPLDPLLATTGVAECDMDEHGACVATDPTQLAEDDDEVDRYAQHMVADIQHVDRHFLNSQDRLIQAMQVQAAESGTTLAAHYCFSMEPVGVSCAGELLRAAVDDDDDDAHAHPGEGRITFHTWPTEGVITMDILTFDPAVPLPSPDRVLEIYGVPRPAEQGDDAPVLKPEIAWFTRARAKTESLIANNDDLDEVLRFSHLKKKRIATEHSPFQRVDVYDVQGQINDAIPLSKKISKHIGAEPVERLVFLDGAVQSREFGEAAYHEALVHPALLLHENPRRVAIIGGGEGATLREVLKHKSVVQAVMVEIDQVMVEASREHLPSWSDCSHLASSTTQTSSCFDDPRAVVYFEDAITWFIERFTDKLNVDRDEGFDVIIMDALDPSSVSEFSDFLYKNEALMAAFSNALGPKGILIAQVGIAHRNDDIPESLDDQNLLPGFRTGLEQSGFQNILQYEEAHARFTYPWSFLLALKDGNYRSSWYKSEAHWNLAIQNRIVRTHNGDTPLRFFDSATMMGYQYPSRVSENDWCRDKPEVCGRYGHQYDPDVMDIPVSAFTIQPSHVPNAGRGAFTNVFIPNGSYMGAGECVHSMFVPPQTNKLIEQMEELVVVGGVSDEEIGANAGHEYFECLGSGYIDGYGWSEDFYGRDVASGVDPGILTFMNHGCNGTYNSGSLLPFTEATYQSLDELPTYDEEYEFFNPNYERHHSFPDCTSNIALRDIEAGEEILCNYLVFDGSFEGEHGLEILEKYRRVCAGDEFGIVTNYEQQQQQQQQHSQVQSEQEC